MGGHRRADLVAHVGEELALGEIGGLRLGQCPAQAGAQRENIATGGGEPVQYRAQYNERQYFDPRVELARRALTQKQGRGGVRSEDQCREHHLLARGQAKHAEH